MKYIEKLNAISIILSKSKKVVSFNRDEHDESNTIAHAFLDIEESSKKLIEELFPRLASEVSSEDEIDDILYDIGEEFRHIIYHITSSKFYEYLKNQ